MIKCTNNDLAILGHSKVAIMVIMAIMAILTILAIMAWLNMTLNMVSMERSGKMQINHENGIKKNAAVQKLWPNQSLWWN